VFPFGFWLPACAAQPGLFFTTPSDSPAIFFSTTTFGHTSSLYISHRDGKTFVDKVKLSNDDKLALGLEGELGKIPLPAATWTAEGLKVQTKNKVGATPARLVAYLNRNPIDLSVPLTRDFGKKGGSSQNVWLSQSPLSPEVYEGFSPEEVIWQIQRGAKLGLERGGNAQAKLPIEAMQEMVAAQNNPNYYGDKYEKLYYISLKKELLAAGIKGRHQGKDECGWYAMGALTDLYLSRKKISERTNIGKLKQNEVRYRLQGGGPTPRGSSLQRTGDAVAAFGVPTEKLSYKFPVTQTLVQMAEKDTHQLWGNKWLLDTDRLRPFGTELIMHELRMGRPIIATMGAGPKYLKAPNGYCGSNAAGKIYPHAVLIVGAYILSPEPNPIVVYEILNSWGPEWGNQGYGYAEPGIIFNGRSFSLGE
jgi:hypothetical protein